MVLFSNNLSNHVWILRCTNKPTGSTQCPKANAYISLLVSPGSTFNGNEFGLVAMGLVKNMVGLVGFNEQSQTPGNTNIHLFIFRICYNT